MKTYSDQTNTLAADAILVAAVDRATKMLRSVARLDRMGAADQRLRTAVHSRAAYSLLVAGEAAELLLNRAALDEEPAS